MSRTDQELYNQGFTQDYVDGYRSRDEEVKRLRYMLESVECHLSYWVDKCEGSLDHEDFVSQIHNTLRNTSNGT